MVDKPESGTLSPPKKMQILGMPLLCYEWKMQLMSSAGCNVMIMMMSH